MAPPPAGLSCALSNQRPPSLYNPAPLQDTSVRCPMSGRRLRASDLVPVRFTPAVPGLPRLQLLGRPQRFVCALSRDALSNATPCAVLRPS